MTGYYTGENEREDYHEPNQEDMVNQLNKGYSQYKKDHIDFAKVVEQDSEGKSNEEFENQFKEKTYHITTITGPQADAIMNIVKRGPAFTFRDKSMPGVSVLEIYSNLDPNKTEYFG